MKAITLVLLSVLTSASVAFGAGSGQLSASSDESVNVTLVEDVKKIPATGSLAGTIVSVYAGTAYALNTYRLVVANTAAACEGDDCMVTKIFDLALYSGQPQAVYSRQVNKTTYSIAVITNKAVMKDDGNMSYKKVKLLITVKFTDEGIEDVADFREVPVK